MKVMIAFPGSRRHVVVRHATSPQYVSKTHRTYPLASIPQLRERGPIVDPEHRSDEVDFRPEHLAQKHIVEPVLRFMLP
ncbi:hypothetical protein LGM65_19355 [Burkholderia anthina]|uniref:hypothetical protein n=1 Tax=Burkholderia anthina TaxID=179879 RepID=UPI001CF27747|nr:hypothetical protein [Burkholderia anthina]MCA8093015.1 hypothetical protein [Burkholderia anthina]